MLLSAAVFMEANAPPGELSCYCLHLFFYLRLPEDVNVTAIVTAVVVVCLVVLICGCGGVLLHRNGFFSRECLFPSFLTFLHSLSPVTWTSLY